MIKKVKVGLLAWLALCSVSLAQTTPNNEQLVQSFRALLSSGSDTQAVIQAVADAVREALKQGPMTQAQVQEAQTASPLAANAPAAAPVMTPPKSWTDAVTLKGDVRYRSEFRQDMTKKNPNGADYVLQG